MGMDFDQLNAVIGTVTQATKQSGQEVGNFVKSVLPRLMSAPAQKALESLNVSMYDDQGKMRNVMDIYTEVGVKMQKLSEDQKLVVSEGLAGKYHITRMQVLLDDLGKANSFYQQMYASSKNAAGSAIREYEVFEDSLQARINRATLAVEKLALALGEAFLTDTMITALEFFSEFLGAITDVVEEVGALPFILGTASVAVAMLSKRFWEGVRSGSVFNITLGSASGAVTKLKFALKGLMASSVVGIIFVGIGTALEFLIGKMGDASARAEEFASKNDLLVNSYSTNRDQVQKLASEYERLDGIINNGEFGVDYDIETLQQYTTISNELASVMPELTVAEDAYGNKIVGSNERIQRKIELLEKQIQLQEKVNAVEKKEEVEDNYETSKKKIEKLQKERDLLLAGASPRTGGYDSWDEIYEKYEQLRSKLEKNGRLSIVQQDEFDFLGNVIAEYEGLSDSIESAKASYQMALMDMINTNLMLDDSLSVASKNMIDTFTTLVATSDNLSDDAISGVFDTVLSKIQDDGSFKKILEDYSNAVIDFQNKINASSDPKDIQKYSEEAKKAFSDVKDALLSSLDGELTKKQIKSLSDELDSMSETVLVSGLNVDKLAESTGLTSEEILTQLGLVGDLEEGMDGLADSTSDAANAQDEITEAFKQSTSTIKELNGMISELDESHQLSADSIGFLMEKYPNLLELIGDETALRKALQQEIIKEEQAAKIAILNKLQYNSDFYKSVISGHSQLVQQFNKLYGVDLTQYKNLAGAKLAVDNSLRGSLAKGWNNFYASVGRGLAFSMIPGGKAMASVMNAVGKVQATKVYGDFHGIFMKGISSGVGGISNSGLKGGSGGGGSKGSGGKSDDDKAREAEEAQRRVLELIKEQIDAIKRRSESLEDDLALEEYYLSKYEKTDAQYRQRQANIAKLKKQQADYHNDIIKYIEGQLKSNKKLNAEQRQELETTLVSTKSTYFSILKDIDSINNDIKESYESIADEVVDVYKQMYETMREEALSAIDEELEALENSHDKKMELLDEELSAYEEIINAKLEALEKEEDEENFQKQLDEKNKERLELQRQINVHSMDDSIEARRKVSELEEELSKKDEELQEFLTDRERQLRKESLQQQMDDKREQIEEERKVEEEKLDKIREQYDKEREYLEEHYENLLEDERAFNKMREQVLAGNINNMNNKLKDFSTFVREHMEGIGQSISYNLIDKIAEAQKKLTGINKSYNATLSAKTPSSPSTSGFSSNSASTSNSSSTPSKPSTSSGTPKKTPTVGGKVKVSNASAKAYRDAYGTKVGNWSTIAKNAGIGTGGQLYLVNQKNGYGALSKSNNINGAIAWIKMDDIAAFEKGGFTGKFKGGKLGILHEEELILNKSDTKNILTVVETVREMVNKLPKITMPKLNPVANSTSNVNHISMPVTIENMNGTKEGVEEFFSEINKEMQNFGMGRFFK